MLSQDRMGMALEFIGKPDKKGHIELPEKSKYKTIQEITEKVLISHQEEEPEGPYREIILAVLEWLIASLSPEFITRNNSEDPYPGIYAVRKGFELMHLLLHRDRRRRLLSKTENITQPGEIGGKD